ncbi:MAG: hypothetical protein V3V96_09810 [Acidiferrobacterales bacterium]
MAERVLQIVKASKPRLRYRAGKDAVLVNALHRILPEAPFERVWWKQFHLDAA